MMKTKNRVSSGRYDWRRYQTRHILIAVLLLCGLVAGVQAVYAQSGGFTLPWWTIDGGGTLDSSGGDFSLSGTLGQPDAGEMGGGPYSLTGGFWQKVGVSPAVEDHVLLLPVLMKNP